MDPAVVPYPDELAQRYRDAGLWEPLTIAQQLHATATRHPDRPALVSINTSLTYAELDRRTDHIAVGLRRLGLQRGDRVLLQVGNNAATVLAWYGLLKAGLVPVATLAHHRTHELGEIAASCKPAAHLIDPAYPACDLIELAEQIAASQPSLTTMLTTTPARTGTSLADLEADGAAAQDSAELVAGYQHGIADTDIAVLQLSGGTTSTPKLIPRLHAEYWYNAKAYATAIGADETSCIVHVLPIVHNAGIIACIHAAHAVGAAAALAPHDEDALLALAQRTPITHMMMSPPMGAAILRRPDLAAALGSMREVAWVLGTMPAGIADVFETATSRFTQMFGQGEGLCMHMPTDAPLELRLRSVGTPISELDEVRVLEPGTERDVQPGQPGELCCRGPYTIRGYYNAPQRNVEAFTSDGFYRTGDIVVELPPWNSLRLFALSDRLKDVISRGGEKINATEVEELLMRHPSVDRAAVVAMPDPRLGERACAFVVPRPGADPLDLAATREHFAALGVAKFKWPERIEIRSELPMTSVTKLNKVALRAEIAHILHQEAALTTA